MSIEKYVGYITTQQQTLRVAGLINEENSSEDKEVTKEVHRLHTRPAGPNMTPSGRGSNPVHHLKSSGDYHAYHVDPDKEAQRRQYHGHVRFNDYVIHNKKTGKTHFISLAKDYKRNKTNHNDLKTTAGRYVSDDVKQNAGHLIDHIVSHHIKNSED